MIWKERLFWAVGIIAVIIYFTKCNQTVCPEIIRIKYDTTIVKGKDSVAWKTITAQGENKTDTFIEYSVKDRWIAVDTDKILSDYFKIRYYEDSTRLQYATITTRDSVTQNKILRHNVTADWRIPVVTKTVTVSLPKKSHFFGGLNFGYNNVGANISFQDTANRTWEAGAIYAGKMYYYIGKKWKIK